jgi:two-component system, OmpR family, response regulator
MPPRRRCFLRNSEVHGRDSLCGGAGYAGARVWERRPDVVVLDVMLPDMDGFEATRQFEAEHARVPIVFLTARDAMPDKLRGLTTGDGDYVTKSFSL